MPEPADHHACLRFYNHIYVTGGWSTGRKAWKYDIINNRWSTLPEMQKSRLGHAMVELNNQIYVLGGHSHGGAPATYTSAELLTNSGWKLLSQKLPSKYWWGGAVVL